MAPIVIIGTGLAGYTLAREFRKLDTSTPLLIISGDDGSAYSKPMLSNGLAQNKSAADLAQADACTMGEQLEAEILTHTRVESIDTRERSIEAAGRSHRYSKLVLAVGASPILLPLEGDGADQVLQVNSLGDYAQFRDRLAGKQSVAIIGAGLIGCEFANDLVQSGYRVTVMGLGDTPLDTLIPAPAGRSLKAGLASAGVQWRLNRSALAVEQAGPGLRVVVDQGDAVEADLVLSAIGLRPDIGLAANAGIRTRRGIVTNTFLETSAEGVYALGDCAEVAGVVRLYVMPIMHGARALARTLCGEATEVRYPVMPVVIKTPAHPVVIGEAADAEPDLPWDCRNEAQGSRCLRYRDGKLVSFCLTGEFSGERQKWLKEMAT